MNPQDDHREFAESYVAHKRDVRFVIITNLLILAVLFGMYFLDQEFGFITTLLQRF